MYIFTWIVKKCKNKEQDYDSETKERDFFWVVKHN